ncbi:MAG: aminoglycoside phosphotransferase family protein [Actinobacteria bacterium]|nr:MAG: aminoglycoside phosphotransferase family protein [Actinomycetota bacterium]
MTVALAGRAGTAWATSREPWALLTDPQRAREVLQQQLYGDLAVEGCEILQTRFRTAPHERRRGAPIVGAAYRLTLRDGEQLVHVRAYTGDGRRHYEKARATARARPRFGPPLAYLPALDAVVWGFPNDPKLRHLADVVDPGVLWRHLPCGSDRVGVDVLRWKPGKRCVTRYRPAGAPAIVGKTVNHDGVADIARRMEWMWRHAHDDADGFVVARPLGCSRAVKTAWQAALPGIPLMQALMDGAEPGPLMRAAGAGLARLHAMAPADDLPHTTVADRLRFVHGGPLELAAAYPELRGRVEALTALLEHVAAQLPPVPDRLVHGDFLLKQLVLSDGRLGVFDFDDFVLGDCVEDLGNCIADMHYWDLDPGAVRAMIADFLDAYRAHAAWDVPDDRLRWHCSVQLLRDAWYWHKRRQFEPAFREELGALLARAEQPPVG